MKLLGVSADVHSVLTAIRIERPLAQLVGRQPGWELKLRSIQECSAADLEWADVLILQRGLTRRAWRLSCAMRASGGQVVYEIDDLLTDMPRSLITYEFVQRNLPWLRRCIAAADMVSVSTARLGRALASPRWLEVPNYGDELANASAAPVVVRGVGAAPALLFASSDRVPVQEVALALRQLQERPEAIGAVIAIGPVGADLVAAGVAVRQIAPMPRLEFLGLLRSLGPVLAVVPLGTTTFDSCKSAIKFFDYALAGIPVICARQPPYSDVTRDGIDAIWVEDSAPAWRAAIETAVAQPERMCALAATAARAVATGFSLEQTVAAWAALLAQCGPRTAAARPAMNPLERAVDSATVWLRRINRQRLRRRAAKRAR